MPHITGELDQDVSLQIHFHVLSVFAFVMRSLTRTQVELPRKENVANIILWLQSLVDVRQKIGETLLEEEQRMLAMLLGSTDQALRRNLNLTQSTSMYITRPTSRCNA